MSRKRWIVIAVGAAVLVLIGAGIWALRGQLAFAEIATGYAAKQTCSCIHISGRGLDSCISDFPEEARDSVQVTQADGGLVRASVLFGAISAQAQYEEGYGCRVLD